MMDELLARYTAITIRHVEDGMVLEPDTIYLMPRMTEMIVSGGRLLLKDKDPNQSLSLPIDHFFRSLARDCGRRGVGIILSGTGTDGSRGIVSIHEAGGLVLVQNLESAKFDGMPRSAADTEICDFVGSPVKIAETLVRHVSGLEAIVESLPESDMQAVLRILLEEHRIDFSHYKPGTLIRRTERRQMLSHCSDLAAYVDRLRKDKQEVRALYTDILIGVTQFFRDSEAFQVFSDEVISKLILDSAESNEIRIWVAGCATGEEAYSLAILFLEKQSKLGVRRNVKIFATDVHEFAVDHAATGIYSAKCLAACSNERLQQFFIPHGDKFHVTPEVRSMIVFAVHNVVTDAPFTRMDVVTCRNLLIYLQPVAQKQAISLFHFGLNAGGILFLGPSETAGDLQAEFEIVHDRWRIMRKRRDLQLPHDMRMQPHVRIPPGQITRPGKLPEPAAADHGNLLPIYDAILSEFMPRAILVNARREVIQTFGDASRFLSLKEGRFANDITEMVGDELRLPLIGLLRRTEHSTQILRYNDLQVTTEQGSETLSLTVRKVTPKTEASPAWLISFDPSQQPPAKVNNTIDVDTADLQRSAVLDRELQNAREHLQATSEKLEASNEEMQTANEELLASNEEMQSTNEELNSVNEELYTVNSEHQRKIAELERMTNDMNNLLRSADVGTIFLDRELNVRHFTPKAASYAKLMPHDIGRNISHFAHNLEYDQFTEDVQDVLASTSPIEREVRDRNGKYFLLRILPYMARNKADGVVLTLIDITRLQRTKERFHNTLAELDQLYHAAPVGLAMFDRDLKYQRVNEIMTDWIGVPAERFIGKTVLDAFPEYSSFIDPHLQNVLASGIAIGPLDVSSGTPGIPNLQRDWVYRFYPITVNEEVIAVGMVVNDITQRKIIERELRSRTNALEKVADELNRSNQELTEYAYVASHDLQEPLRAVTGYCDALQEDFGDVLTGDANLYLSFIVDGARRMQRLIDDLLRYSKVSRGESQVEEIPLGETLNDATELMVSRIQETQALIRAPKLPTIRGERVLLTQLFQNLISNAIKFRKEGVPPQIDIAVKEVGRFYQFTFTDNGIGFEDSHSDRIFQIFQRLHTRDKFPGTGIGLAVCRKIVERHGGQIRATSTPGIGTSFLFSIPKDGQEKSQS